MNFPAILDVGLGLAVVFFLLASICSILVEIIAGRKQWRHQALKTAVNALLQGHDERKRKPLGEAAADPKPAAEKNPQGEDVLDLFWNHPEIEPLRAADTESPGYLDATRFAAVVLDIATGKGQDGVLPNSRAAFGYAFEKHAPTKLRERLNSLLRNLPANTVDVRAAITAAVAKWFDEAMARTTGNYKRKVQAWLFWTGLTTALFLNCDTLRVSYVLFRDPGLRSSMVDYAKSLSEPAAAATNAPASPSGSSVPITDLQGTNAVTVTELRSALRIQIKELQTLERIGFPIGWVTPFAENFLPFRTQNEPLVWTRIAAAGFLKLIGLIATAFAVCLGAPFWFDVLNKLVKLRSAGGKPGSDAGGGGTSTPTSGATPSGPATGSSAGAVSRAPNPLPSIGEALRAPSTQFQAAKAYWLAEASFLAYSAPTDIDATVKGVWRLDRVIHFNDAKTNTQGFLAVGGGVAILAFRGTEPGQLPDWQTDAQAFLKPAPDYPGQVHSGFVVALAGVYAAVKTSVDALPGSGALLYITGHSLGAALATLCAHRLTTARGYPIQGVYNYGSPRVGNPDFAKNFQSALGARTYRLVNNEDLVTRVPPRAVGYEHVGEMVYIDETGRLQRDIGFWYRFLNLAANAAEDFKQAAKTTVRDHSMTLYCEHLKRAATAPES